MAHPYEQYKAHRVARSRANEIAGGAHDDVAEDRRLIREEVKTSALKRASGGRAKSPVNVNITVEHGSQGTPGLPMPPKAPMPPPAGSPSMPMPPPGLAGGPLPMRKRGGRVGAGWSESMKNATPVQHSPGKNDLGELGRGKPVTYAKGGPVSSEKAPMGPKMPGGARGGLARLVKAHRAAGK